MCHFFASDPAGGRPPCQAPCEDLGVNAGFKAWFVCVCAWWREGVVGGLGGLVSDGGRRSLSLPALT